MPLLFPQQETQELPQTPLSLTPTPAYPGYHEGLPTLHSWHLIYHYTVYKGWLMVLKVK